jgi:ubiquitin C-terminal hydrolase
MMELRRFQATPYGLEKIDIPLAYPDEIDLSERVMGPQHAENLRYRLSAVCEHIGSVNGGHYTAHAAMGNGSNRKWWAFNDADCSAATVADAHNERAYVLFYEQIPPEDDGGEVEMDDSDSEDSI